MEGRATCWGGVGPSLRGAAVRWGLEGELRAQTGQRVRGWNHSSGWPVAVATGEGGMGLTP